MISFDVIANPPTITAQQKGTTIVDGRIVYFEKPEVQVARHYLTELFREFAPEKPLDGPVRVFVVVTYPWNGGESQKHRLTGWRWKDTAPDADNTNKLFQDVLSDLRFWKNDSRIASLNVEKGWGDIPGFRVLIHQLSAADRPLLDEYKDSHR